MIRKLFNVLLLAAFCTANAQDKAIDLPLQPKNRLVQYFFANNGTSYVATSNDKDSKVTLSSYDSIFNLKFSKEYASEYQGRPAFFGRGMNTPQSFYSMEGTPGGKYAICYNDHLLFDGAGKSKTYNFYPETQKDFETNFSRFSDDYFCYFGYKKIKENKKKTFDETYFCKIKFTDLTKSFVEIKFPPVVPVLKDPKPTKDEDKSSWGISCYDNKQFFMINKEMNKDRNENQYNIAGFDYDGNMTKALSLPVKLKNKYLALANTGFGSYSIMTSTMASVGLMGDDATGNMYVEGNNEFFYIYGLYTNAKGGDFNKMAYNGFYIYKFNAKGEVVWKTEQPIYDSSGFNTTQRPIGVNVDFTMLNNNQAGFRIYSFYQKYVHLFAIDTKTGKVLKTQKPDFKLEGTRFEGIKDGSFKTGYAMDKVYKNKHFDINTIYAAFLNPKVDAFLKTASKGDMNYNCEITANGIYFIEENRDAETFRLMKFDW